MLIQLDRSRKMPVYRQIIDSVKSMADDGVLESDHPLPSTRRMAERLGVNRSTVTRAYEELQALGCIDSRPGSYNRVMRRRKKVPCDPGRQSLIEWGSLAGDPGNRIYDRFQRYSPERPLLAKYGADAIDLASLDLDHRVYPVEDFRHCVNTVLEAGVSEEVAVCRRRWRKRRSIAGGKAYAFVQKVGEPGWVGLAPCRSLTDHT